MTVESIAAIASFLAAAAGIAHAAHHGYLRAPDKYGHPLVPRDPKDTDAWDAWVATRRLRHAAIPFLVCTAIGLAIGVIFLY